MFKTNGIFDESDIFLNNVGHSFETSWCNFFYKNQHCVPNLIQNLCIEEKNYKLPDSFKKIQKFLSIEACIYDTYRIVFLPRLPGMYSNVRPVFVQPVFVQLFSSNPIRLGFVQIRLVQVKLGQVRIGRNGLDEKWVYRIVSIAVVQIKLLY